MLRVAQRLTDAEALKLAGYAGGVH